MNCFVIMPFAQEFDDVYSTIKTSVEVIMADRGRCFRLDELRPAGRITDRLLAELRLAELCVTDVTGTKPNVMWEVGYAMAMGIPTILVTQSLKETPFDIRDMQTIEYDRNRLQRTLAEPLKRVVLDTLAHEGRHAQNDHTKIDVVGELRGELAEMKRMLAQVVGYWSGPTLSPGLTDSGLLERMEGAWLDEVSGSHIYVRVIDGELVAPYCWSGNDCLNAVFFGWKRTGDYWFSQYTWLDSVEGGLRGFTFLKEESVEVLRGAWWVEIDEVRKLSAPPDRQGVGISLRRLTVESFPAWAEKFFADVQAGRVSLKQLASDSSLT